MFGMYIFKKALPFRIQRVYLYKDGGKYMDKTKRLCIILGGQKFGGAERVACILANHYNALGWDVDVIALLKGDCEFQLDNGISFTRLGSSDRSRLATLPVWLKYIAAYTRKKRPDIILSFSVRINCITLASRIFAGSHDSKLVISERNDPKHDTRTLPVKLLTYFLYPFTDGIVFQTGYARDCFPKMIARKGCVIGNPVIDGLPKAVCSSDRIVTMGKLEKQKNHALLIDAYSRISDKYPETTLHIYGEGELRADTEKMITEKGMNERVIIEGWKKNVHDEISDARLFVLSSDYEGLSNALLEASTMGLPCVTTKCAGAEETILDNETGIICDTGDVEALSNALDRMLSDRKRSEEMGRRGAEHCKRFAADIILGEWDKALMKFL